MKGTGDLLQKPNLEFPLQTVRITQAAVTQTMRDTMVHALEHPEEIEKQKAEAARKKEEELARWAKKLNEPPEPLNLGGASPYPPTTAPSAPLPDGRRSDGPSTNGGKRLTKKERRALRRAKRRPSANGINGCTPPSGNGGNGHVPPSPNGEPEDAERERAIRSIAARLGYDWPPK
jgi:hypothetical protein